jgi:hypothetical protein
MPHDLVFNYLYLEIIIMNMITFTFFLKEISNFIENVVRNILVR